jgi:hypothetical protein
MRRAALLGLAALTAVLSADAAPASAQGFRLYPWCAVGTRGGGHELLLFDAPAVPGGRPRRRRPVRCQFLVHGLRPELLLRSSQAVKSKRPVNPSADSMVAQLACDGERAETGLAHIAQGHRRADRL